MALGRIFRPVVDTDRCGSCGVCLRGCPVEVIPELREEEGTVRGAVYAAAAARDGTEAPPCQAACPLGQKVREYVGKLARGQWRDALLTVRQDNPLPSLCGYLCHHPCQAECLRSSVDGPVAIRELKRLATRYEREHVGEVRTVLLGRRSPPNGKRVAVVGSGPAGLTAAHDLALAGCEVTIVEAERELGGALRLAIPDFRLPRPVLDREISLVTGLGVRVEAGRAIAGPRDLAALQSEGHDAVLLAFGAQRGAGLDVPGWDGGGCDQALAFLKQYNAGRAPLFEGSVVVVGGGNVALDAARAALRCGAGEVWVVYRRDRGQMPVDPVEFREAEAEGVRFRFRAVPAAVERRGGEVRALRCRATELGLPDSGGRPVVVVSDEELCLRATRVIAAVGQSPEHPCLPATALRPDGRALVEAGSRVRGMPGLFAAGDGVSGPSYVVEAMASGRAAARDILT